MPTADTSTAESPASPAHISYAERLQMRVSNVLRHLHAGPPAAHAWMQSCPHERASPETFASGHTCSSTAGRKSLAKLNPLLQADRITRF